MKSYGKIDSSSDMPKLRLLLENASKMAKVDNTSFYIGEDKDENIIITPDRGDSLMHIFLCRVRPKKILDHWADTLNQEEIEKMLKEEFEDNVEYRRYTIDEMVPRAYDCLVNGRIEYGNLGFLSEGRIQLAKVFKDAKKMVEKHAKPFIVGLSKKNKTIMISPASERSKFFAPLSCVVTKFGVWSVSEMCSDMIGVPSYRIDTTTEMRTLNRLDRVGPLHMLYKGIGYGKKAYGKFGVGDDNKEHCILRLESAFEDAVRMPRRNGGNDERYCVILDGHEGITMQSIHRNNIQHRENNVYTVEVNPEEFLDGDTLLREKVSAAARETYEKFCQVIKNA